MKTTMNITKRSVLLLYALFAALGTALAGCTTNTNTQFEQVKTMDEQPKAGNEIATFGTGCFWCTEAVFQSLKGVYKVESGYSGGKVINPTYKAVCEGTTGHAEVVQITYDPKVISFAQLMEVFFKTHDPTTLNRQGADEGTQYRSAVFYHNEEQRKFAEEIKAKLNAEKAYDSPIVTEVTAFTKFYKAEDYHQDYYNLNGQSNGYCRMVIQPKLDKFKKSFAAMLK
jgi:peptide-methionine (S)-S-oxide reductase